MPRGVRRRLQRAEIVRNWREWIPGLVEAARGTLGKGVEVYVFGAAAEGRLTAASDVDVLVVVDAPPQDFFELERLKEELERRAGLPRRHPFEIHLVGREEAEFYLRALRVTALRVA